MKRVVACIFARGGSKGIPGKNLSELAGKPLIAHAIECARAVSRVERVVVSTDDETIASTARRWGAETPFLRPAELASDEAPEWLAWRHAIDWLIRNTGPFDAMLSVPATSPFRSPADLERCIDLLFGEEVDVVITATRAARHPSFNMVRLDAGGLARLASPLDSPIHRRQDAPPVFDMTTVAYCVKPDFVLQHAGLFEGRVKMLEVPAERALDIDTELDLEFARFLALKSPEILKR